MTPAPGPRGTIRRALVAAAGCVLALGVAVADAALYKWTDANGRVIYSDQPPTGGVRYEILGAAPPPDNPNAVRDMANKDMELKKLQKDRAEDAAKTEKAQGEAARRADNCAKARSAVRMYQDENQSIYVYNDKGERVVVTPDERKRRLDEQQKIARDYCAS